MVGFLLLPLLGSPFNVAPLWFRIWVFLRANCAGQLRMNFMASTYGRPLPFQLVCMPLSSLD